ncbi:hypothetical protein VTN00DRAFT_7285 [Thermoascus crustaceus]|uniref:uncharacterized protein n=1 Tax=Thermoascus crustaceus TaxID=5088 RepID=UPI003742A68D
MSDAMDKAILKRLCNAQSSLFQQWHPVHVPRAKGALGIETMNIDGVGPADPIPGDLSRGAQCRTENYSKPGSRNFTSASAVHYLENTVNDGVVAIMLNALTSMCWGRRPDGGPSVKSGDDNKTGDILVSYLELSQDGSYG